MMSIKLLLLLSTIGLAQSCIFGRRQKYTVHMELFCGNRPASDVLVKLKDYDTGPSIDDAMGQGRTDSRGFLELSGEECELTDIDPRVDIYHDCNDVEQKTRIPKVGTQGPSIDDAMGQGRTDSRGFLELSGEECELTDIDPRVDIYHDCNDVEQKTRIPKVGTQGPSIDDAMGQGRTDSRGFLELSGEECELTDIDPRVDIYHDCNDVEQKTRIPKVGTQGPSIDDAMGQGRTDSRGFLELSGEECELTDIDPRVDIYHDCNDVEQKTRIPKVGTQGPSIDDAMGQGRTDSRGFLELSGEECELTDIDPRVDIYHDCNDVEQKTRIPKVGTQGPSIDDAMGQGRTDSRGFLELSGEECELTDIDPRVDIYHDCNDVEQKTRIPKVGTQGPSIDDAMGQGRTDSRGFLELSGEECELTDIDPRVDIYHDCNDVEQKTRIPKVGTQGPSIDDAMGQGRTDSRGFLELSGEECELTDIDPRVDIYHDCNDVEQKTRIPKVGTQGPSIDDAMGQGRTDSRGFLELSGEECELTDIDPRVDIYHDCNDVEQKTRIPKVGTQGPSIDDAMGQGRTDSRGFLELSGEECELTDIDPRVDIYHDCNDVEQKTRIPKVGTQGPSIDDAMGQGRTDSRGFLELSGEECELTDIDPRVDIYHDCNDVEQKTRIPKPCQRKWKIMLPQRPYINGKPMNMGRINLEMMLKDEDRDCIH